MNDNGDKITTTEQTAISIANQQRAITEVQASITIAKQFPRDEESARQKILNACARPALATKAIYLYARGGQDITGETVRLAEEMARQWGNLDYGWRVLDHKAEYSQVEAMVWDKETNVRQARQFIVSHQRVTKTKTYMLTDPRDIYEKQANEAARRMRACILAMIPKDIRDEAIEACDKTMKTKVKITPELIKKLVSDFALLGVTKHQIEKRIQRNLESIQPAQVVQLGKIYNSIKEGMSTPESWFDASGESAERLRQAKKEKEEKTAETIVPNTGEVLEEPPADVDLPKE